MDFTRTYFIQIPARTNEYNYEFSIVINETTYILWLYYNRRMSRWILNVKDENNDYIIMGIPILIGSQLLKRFADQRISDIKFIFVYNLKSDYIEIEEDDLGNTAYLFVAKELEE